MKRMHKSKHLGFKGLERKVAYNERREHPTYTSERIGYIARATAGKVAREKRAKRGF